ncbi:hypothetical protein [Pararhizobium polonicum]|uniref:hypothetical protein n=1 Tax=Pararhizobium polonicum TaxID=1612624 RepID=UPI001111F7A5|nr:hypothetical protein [Pararhizobium polonicum]
MKKMAHHRYPLPEGPRPSRAATEPESFPDDAWLAHAGSTGMPVMARICALRSGKRDGEPRLLTAADLRETLLLALGPDAERVSFVCRQIEETGACELGDGSGQSGYVIEKVLHA